MDKVDTLSTFDSNTSKEAESSDTKALMNSSHSAVEQTSLEQSLCLPYIKYKKGCSNLTKQGIAYL